MVFIEQARDGLTLIRSRSDLKRAKNAQEAFKGASTPWSTQDNLCSALKECCSANDALVKKDPVLFLQYAQLSKNNIEKVRVLLRQRKLEYVNSGGECSQASRAFCNAYAKQKQNGPEIVQLKTDLFEKIDKYNAAASKFLPKEKALWENKGLRNLKCAVQFNCDRLSLDANNSDNSGLSLKMIIRSVVDYISNNKVNLITCIGILYMLSVVAAYASIFNQVSTLFDGGFSQVSGQGFSAGLV